MRGINAKHPPLGFPFYLAAVMSPRHLYTLLLRLFIRPRLLSRGSITSNPPHLDVSWHLCLSLSPRESTLNSSREGGVSRPF